MNRFECFVQASILLKINLHWHRSKKKDVYVVSSLSGLCFWNAGLCCLSGYMSHCLSWFVYWCYGVLHVTITTNVSVKSFTVPLNQTSTSWDWITDPWCRHGYRGCYFPSVSDFNCGIRLVDSRLKKVLNWLTGYVFLKYGTDTVIMFKHSHHAFCFDM